MSDPIPDLAAALVSFQARMPTVAKAQRAQVPTKAGGSYSYTYAGLPDVVAAVTPLLTDCGLAFTVQPHRGEDGTYEVVGVLLHTSGQSIAAALPLFGRQAQEIGSSLTYARRYLLGCLTGVVTDDDDDGTLAQQSQRRVEQTAEDRPMSAPTRARLFALMGEVGDLADADAQRAFLGDTVGRVVDSRGSLTEAEALRAGRRVRAWRDGDERAAWVPTDRGENAQTAELERGRPV